MSSKVQDYYEWKHWKKLSWQAQEHIIRQNPNVKILNYVSRKDKIIKVINAVDITQAEGQKNFDTVVNKVEKGFEKVDSIFNELDNALVKIGGSNKTESLLDDPWGDKNNAQSIWKDPGAKGKKPKKTKGFGSL